MRLFQARTVAVIASAAIGVTAFQATAWATHGSTEDQATAEAGLLVQTDFPADWTEEPPAADPAGVLQKAVSGAGKVCSQLATVLKAGFVEPHASSSTFTGEGATAENTDIVFTAPSDATAALAAFKAVSTRNCLAKALPKALSAALAANADVGKVASVSVKVSPGSTATIADANRNYETKATVKLKNGKKVTAFVNTEAVVEGRVFDLFQFVKVGEALDGIHDHLIASSVGRLQGALGLLAVGETALLAGSLTPVPQYTYVESTSAQQQDISQLLADPDVAQYLDGQSLHSVLHNGISVGVIEMTQFKQQYAAQPGFKEEALTEWAASDAEASDGVIVTTAVGGRPVAVVTGSNGLTGTIFFSKNVLVAIYSAGSNPIDTAAFAAEFISRSPS